jgi:hypothetical protein
MMGETVTRNMWSKSIAENKNAIVAYCWTYFTTIKKLCSCGKEQMSTAVATDTGKCRRKIIDPVSTELYEYTYRPRETERGERGGRNYEYGGRVYEK